MQFLIPIFTTIFIYAVVVSIGLLWYRIRQNRFRIKELVGRRYTVLEILVPKNNDKGPLAAENMFAALHGIFNANAAVQEQLSFEIASRGKFILFYVYAPVHLKDFVEGQIYAQYSTVEIREVPDYVSINLGSLAWAGSELLLNNSDFFPIKTFANFEVDPLAGITGVLSRVNDQEQIWLQMLIRPINDSWKDRGVKYIDAIRKGESTSSSSFGSLLASGVIGLGGEVVKSILGRSSSGELKAAEGPQLSGLDEAGLKGVEEKVTKLGFETKIRIVAVANTIEEASQKIYNLVGAFKQFNMTHLNGFSHSMINARPDVLEQYQGRRFGGPGYILNITELASVYHLPNITVETPLIAWAGSKKGEPPANLPIIGSAAEEELTVFGETNFRHFNQKFGIRRQDRRLHMYAIGKTGTGKSTMLENMIIDDIRHGRGVGVIDPHGELIEHILEYIPKERIDDVIWFAPHDRDRPIGFNVLEMVEPDLRGVVASGVVGIYKKIFGESWGPRLEYILRNAVLSLLEYPSATMLGITRILVDKNYRRKVVDNLTDPVVKDFWVNEFEKYDPKFRTEAVAPIQNKVGQFLSSATIRNIVGQQESTMNLRDIMDNRKIFLVDLSIGKIGEDASSLMGAMMITKIQLTAMQRANMPEADRVDFYLYVDEFQNFATESFSVILSEARKYHLNLVMTHQFIAQMPEIVAKAVFGNVGSIVSFRVGSQDASVLAQEFEPVFTANDLVNLDNYHIYVKMAIDGVTSPAFSAVTLPPHQPALGNREQVVEASRKKHARNRGEVEEQIRRSVEDDSAAPQKLKPILTDIGEKTMTAYQGGGYREVKDRHGRRWYILEVVLPTPFTPSVPSAPSSYQPPAIAVIQKSDPPADIIPLDPGKTVEL